MRRHRRHPTFAGRNDALELQQRRSDDALRAEFELKNSDLQIRNKSCMFVGPALPPGVMIAPTFFSNMNSAIELECYSSNADGRAMMLNDGYTCPLLQVFAIAQSITVENMPYVRLVTPGTNEIVCVRWHIFKKNFIPNNRSYVHPYTRTQAQWERFNDDLENNLRMYRRWYKDTKDHGVSSYSMSPYAGTPDYASMMLAAGVGGGLEMPRRYAGG